MARPVEVKATIRDRMTQRLQRMDRQIQRHGRSWERAGRVASRATRAIGTGVALLDRSLHRLWRRARLAMLGLQVFASVMAGMAVNAALKYERAIRSVMTLMEGAGSATAEFEANFSRLDSTLRKLSTETKQTPQALAEGMYEVVSTGFEAADATAVLEAAAKGAYAGLTDVDTVTALLTQTLQAYRKEGESGADLARKSTSYVDMFFNAVNKGVFTFGDLAQSFGDIGATAAAFNIPLEETLAFLSTATIRGVGLDESITALRQTILSIASPAAQVREAVGELYGSKEEADEWFSASALAHHGLEGVLTKLSETIHDKITPELLAQAEAMEENGSDAAFLLAESLGLTAEQFSELFPNVRALKGVLAVTGPGLQTFADHIDHIGSATGTTANAVAEIDKSASGALQGLKAVWEQFKLDVGNIALPWIKSISDSVVEWWGGIPERFARESGFSVDLNKIAGDSIAERAGTADEMVSRFWADADPGEKIGFILKTAWSDAIAALTTWFDGEGQGKISALGEKIGRFFGDALMAMAGFESKDIEENIFYQIGRAAARGFAAGFKEEFDLGDFAQGAVSGDNPLSLLLGGYAAVKWGPGLLKKLLLGGGGRAAAGAAGKGAAGAAGKGAAGGLLGWLGAKLGMGALGTAGLVGVNAAMVADPGFTDFLRHAGWFIPGFGVGASGTANQPPPLPTVPTSHPTGRRSTSTGGITDVGAVFGTIKASAGEIDDAGSRFTSGADSVALAGSRFASASSIIMSAAIRLSNTKISVTGGGGGIQAKAMAEGGEGTVRKPTLFLAGEAGEEDFSFTPRGKRGRGGGKRVVIQGPLVGSVTVAGDYDVDRMLDQINRKVEKALGNG